ncbi:MAG: hypothetical protein VYC34_02900, partial [Planctomycetota bacterium]|nr:hypothetical protein [Planctomycetota bacterium]
AFLASAGFGDEEASRIRSIITNDDDISKRLAEESRDEPGTVVGETKAVIADAKAVSGDFRQRSPEWFDRADTITTNFSEFSTEIKGVGADFRARIDEAKILMDRLRDLVDTNRPKADAVMDNIQAFTDRLNTEYAEKVSDLLDQGNAALTDARDAVDRVDAFIVEQTPNLRASLANARLASDQLKFTLAEVRRSPWRLLYRPEMRELNYELLYDSARAYAEAVSDLRAASQSAEAALNSGAAPSAAQTESLENITAEIEAALEKYRAAEQSFMQRLLEEQQ